MPSNDPVVSSAIYDGQTVKVRWQTSADTGVTGYVIALSYLGQTGTAYQSPVINGRGSTSGTLNLPSPLNTDVTYRVTVIAMWSTGPGEQSAPVVLPTLPPTLVSALYNGSDVEFAWMPVDDAACGYELIVYSVDSGQLFNVTIPDRAASRGVIPASVIGSGGLAPDLQWVATVGALGENNMSARCTAAQFPNPLRVPVLTSPILYQAGNRILARWSPLPQSGLAGFRLSVVSPQNDSHAWVNILNASAVNGILPLAAPLAENQSFTFRLAATMASNAGTITTLSPIVSTTPVVTSAAYNGNQVALTWTMTSNPAVTGFTLIVVSLSSGMSFSANVAGGFETSGTIPLSTALDVTQTWVCRVIANGPVAAQSVDMPLPVTPVAISSVEVDGDMLSVGWTAAIPAPQDYLLTLLSSGTMVASVPSAGTDATLRLPSGLASPTVTVAPRIGNAVGPAGAAVKVINTAPAISSFATDVISGKSTLNWTGVSSATGYALKFSDGGSATEATTSYAFPAPLPVNTPVSATIRAQITTGAVVSTGPASQPFPLATARGTLRSADFNGIEATVAWIPVPQASGYRVSIRKDGPPQTEVAHFDAPAGATSASAAFTPPDAAAVYLASVQAQFSSATAASTGPSSPTLPLFQPGFFPSSAPASTTFPYLYPATKLATVLATPPSEAVTLYLPPLGAAALIGLPITKGVFTLAVNSDGGTAATYPYTLTLAAGAWSFTTAPIRVDLRRDYIAFLKEVEQPGGASPSGILLLQQAILRFMPQTFQEILYYGYGLSFPSPDTGDTIGYADLRPGMVLRVAADPFQTITESSALRWSTGYVGGPVIDYDVGGFIDSAGATTTGYDSFIGQLVAGGALTVPPPPSHPETQQAGGVADAADLYFPGFRTSFYRLFVPTQLATASAPCPTTTPSSFVLAAAATSTALTTASNVPGGTSPIAYFRGRAVLRPCLRVTLNGAGLVVPVGTTVGNLLERAGHLPAFAAMPVDGLMVRRALGPVVLDPEAPLSANASFPIRLDWKMLAAYGPGWTAFALPLLPGDAVSTHAS
jgi:trimeric autotransporter adhesin